jgi:hypothetical protein
MQRITSSSYSQAAGALVGRNQLQGGRTLWWTSSGKGRTASRDQGLQGPERFGGGRRTTLGEQLKNLVGRWLAEKSQGEFQPVNRRLQKLVGRCWQGSQGEFQPINRRSRNRSDVGWQRRARESSDRSIALAAQDQGQAPFRAAKSQTFLGEYLAPVAAGEGDEPRC